MDLMSGDGRLAFAAQTSPRHVFAARGEDRPPGARIVDEGAPGQWARGASPFLVFQLDHSEFPDEVLYFVTGFPRLSVTAIDPQGLRTELSRLLVN